MDTKKVKIIQFGLHGGSEREVQSQQQLQSLTSNYTRIENARYSKEPPINEIFEGRKDWYVGLTKEPDTWGLTPPHYGCWLGHKQAIQLGFCENEHFLVCEGDCRILDMDLFKTRLQEAIKVHDEQDYPIIRFEEPNNELTTTFFDQVSKNIWEFDNIALSHCYLVNKKSKPIFDWLFLNVGWHTPDWWLNFAFPKADIKMLCFNEKLTTQFDGFSEIDKIEKNYL
jgi:hypothetical protein